MIRMTHLHRLVVKLRNYFRRQSTEQDLGREIASHLSLMADEFERRGMNPEEARMAARRSFGNVEKAKELSRDARFFVWLEQTRQDLRHACRSISHNPGFSLVTVLTLAVGIGVNCTFFTAYNALVLKPLPVADPAHVVRLERWFERGKLGGIQYAFSYPEYVYCRDHNDVLAGLVAASWPIHVVAQMSGNGSHEIEEWHGELASENYFTHLGIAAAIGRTYLADDEHSATPVLVLSDSFWLRRFNHDPRVLGRVVVLNRVPFTIVGVTPEAFSGTSIGLQTPDFWAPLSTQKQLTAGHDWMNEPKVDELQLLARLKPSIPLKSAQAEIDALIRQFGATYEPDDRTRTVTLQHTSFLGNTEDARFRAAVAALMMIVGMVLLAACANVANMLFARGVARRQEIGIRLALGASRGRVVRHLIAESMLLSFIGGMLGLVLSIWASSFLWIAVKQMLAGPLTQGLVIQLNLSPDQRVFAYALVISVLAGILFGLAPALRSTTADLTTAMKNETGVFGSRPSSSWIRSALVAAQVAVATILLITAGLLMRGMIRSLATSTGFETHRVLLLSADFGSTPAKASAMEHRVLDRLQTVPVVANVALGWQPLMGHWTPPIVVKGPRGTVRGRTLASYASDTYFDTLSIPILRGRTFTRQETEDGARVAVISEATAHRFWPEEDALGKRFELDMDFRGKLTRFEVVGIVKDIRFANLTRIDPAHVYLPTAAGESYAILVRVRGDVGTAVSTVRTALTTVDRTLPPSVSLVTIEDGPLRIQRSFAQMLAMLGVVLAFLAVTLSAVGIYGVMAFLVNQRQKEIGIRIALGATSAGVLNAVVVQGLRPVLAGIAFGTVVAGGLFWALHTSLAFPGTSDLLYGVAFYDPATFVGVLLLLMSVAAAASVLPAGRAIRVDPVAALRFQ